MISFNGNCQSKCRFQRINTPFRSFARRFQYLPVLLSRLFLVTFLKAYFSKEIRNYLGLVPPERIPCMKEYIRVKNRHSAVVKNEKSRKCIRSFFSNIFSCLSIQIFADRRTEDEKEVVSQRDIPLADVSLSLKRVNTGVVACCNVIVVVCETQEGRLPNMHVCDSVKSQGPRRSLVWNFFYLEVGTGLLTARAE